MILALLLKYFIEGLAIAFATQFVTKNKLNVMEIVSIAFTGSTMFLVLDLFAPSIGESARTGAGFGLGAKSVGFAEKFAPIDYEHADLPFVPDQMSFKTTALQTVHPPQ